MKKLNVYTINCHVWGIVFKDLREDGHKVVYACGQDGGRYQGLKAKGNTAQEAFDNLRALAESDVWEST